MDVVAHVVPAFLDDESVLPALRELVQSWMASDHPRRLRIFGLEQTADGWTLLTAPEPPFAFRDVVQAARTTSPAERIPWAVARLLEVARAAASLGDGHGELDSRTVGFEGDGRATLLPPFPRVAHRVAYTGQSPFRHAGIAWMSPEAIRGERCAAASDVYQLGYLGWKLFGAAHPFDGRSEIETLRGMMEKEPIGRLRDVIDVPPALDDAITRALSYEVAGRFAGAAELADAIAPFAAESSALRESIVARVPATAGGLLGTLLQGPVRRPCLKRWDELSPTDRQEVRHCSDCALPVQRVRTVAALVPLTGSCVFYDPIKA